MRKLAFTLTAAAACTLSVSLSGGAQAGALGGAEGIRAALDTTNLVEQVHCRPGRPHHSSFRTPDGCEGRQRHSRRYVQPRYGYQPYYGSPYGYQRYGYQPQYYPFGYSSPGISFGFSTGPRYRHYW